MQFLTVIKTIISILPLVIQAIDAIEAAFPVSGKGAAKLDVVKAVLAGSIEVADDVDNGQFDKIWTVVNKVVSAVVAMRKS